MAEETDTVEAEEEVQEEEVSEEVSEDTEEYSEEEQRAAESGWMPKDKFDEAYGEDSGKTWVDAHEFNVRGELMDRIKSQGKKLGELEGRLNNVNATFNATVEAETKRRIANMKRERDEALLEGDDEAVSRLDDSIESETEALYSTPKDSGPAPEVDEGIQRWSSNNKWYAADPVMRGAADALAQTLRDDRPDLVGEEFLNTLTSMVKKEFPHKFGNTQRKSPPNVGGASRGGGRKNKDSITRSDLDADRQRLLSSMSKSTGLSEAEIIQSWLDIGAIVVE